eukprot:TRINITY_DN4623_c0_g1_i1.p1 TRINITY_DN4623_c0_g1~~TRINITY_DN4623_c0_g1_i1.p1  ORF type:complete len:433 (-),score=93.14 TRINITY_DN4623_c0_g1_i1:155-1453(-)
MHQRTTFFYIGFAFAFLFASIFAAVHMNPIQLESSTAKRSFGKSIRDWWTLDPNTTFLNHGSYGATPKTLLAARDQWQATMENQPVKWFMTGLWDAYYKTIEKVAAFVGADSKDVVLVPNATTGSNAVLNSLTYRPGDRILFDNTIYGAVERNLQFLKDRYGVELVCVNFTFPFSSNEEILRAYEAAMKNGPYRIAVFSHITSSTGLLMPIQGLVDLARKYNIESLVDGAHAPGIAYINIRELRPDYYIGNFHKWMCNPKGGAFLWVQESLQAKIHPAIISHNYGVGFQKEFEWTGTDDISNQLTVSDTIDWFLALGQQDAMAYQANLRAWAVDYLVTLWKTEPMAPPHMLSPAMANIRVPDVGLGSGPADAALLHDILLHNYQIEVVCLSLQDRLWIRISSAIYNAEEDYIRLGDAIMDLHTHRNTPKAKL